MMTIQEPVRPIVITPKKRQAKNQSVAALMASDWHVEEEVRPDQVGGLNRYSLEIAEARIDKFWRNGLALVNAARGSTQIDRLLLLMMGDFYSGHIHEDLVESTSLSPVESIAWLQPRICAGIDFLLEHGDFDRIDFVGKIGNHSRLTKKPRVSTAEKHSLEWLLYHVIADKYKAEKRLQFTLTPAYHTMIDCFGVPLRVHHGDWLNYGGGIGGLGVPLNKAISRWNTSQRADLDAIGHWHSWLSSIGRCVVNGSLIGVAPYSIKIKAEFERPQQGFFVISEKYQRETLRAPVFVE